MYLSNDEQLVTKIRESAVPISKSTFISITTGIESCINQV